VTLELCCREFLALVKKICLELCNSFCNFFQVHSPHSCCAATHLINTNREYTAKKLPHDIPALVQCLTEGFDHVVDGT